MPGPCAISLNDKAVVAQAIISGIGLISLFLLWYQVRQTTRWNKVQSQFQFVNLRNKKSETKNAESRPANWIRFSKR